MARSAALLQALEVGTCRLAGHLPAVEDAAVLRQAGQHQPDRVAAAVVSYDVLAHAATEPMHIVTPNRRRPPRPRGPDAAAAGVDAPPDRRLRRPSQRQRSFP